MLTPYREDHEQFRKTVRSFAERELAPQVDRWEAEGCVPRSVFARAGELGIFGAHYPEACGGAGGDFWFSVVKSEELPRCGSAGTTLGLLVQSDMATPAIADLGTKEQHEEFLAPALRGEKIACLGVTEPDAGSDVAAIKTWARRDGDDYIVNGSKTFITNGTRADFIMLLVKTRPEAGAHGCSFFLVPTATKGFGISKTLRKLGNHASDTAELHFEEMRVPKRYLLGEESLGFAYLMQNFQSERLIASTSALAGAQLMLDQAIAYAADRKVMGKPVLKREYWQQTIAGLATKLEAGRALCYRAVAEYQHEKYEKGQPLSADTVKLISMCKVFVGDVTTEVTDQALQLHGGNGYMDEYAISRAWRDQRLFRIGGGTTETMRYYIAKLMGL